MRRRAALLLLPLVLLMTGCSGRNTIAEQAHLEQAAGEAGRAFDRLGRYDASTVADLGEGWGYIYPAPDLTRIEAHFEARPDLEAALVSEGDPHRAIVLINDYPYSACQVLEAGKTMTPRDGITACYDQLVQNRLDELAESANPVVSVPSGVDVSSQAPPDLLTIDGREIEWTISETAPGGAIFSITSLEDGRQWRTCYRLDDEDRVAQNCLASSGTFARSWPAFKELGAAPGSASG